MRPDRLLLQDIQDSVVEVIDTTPAAQVDVDTNKLVQSQVLRHIQIIGEASWRLSQSLKDQYPQVPWKKISGMRHVLVHDYIQVNWNRAYETARDHVPVLKPQIEGILAALPPDQRHEL